MEEPSRDHQNICITCNKSKQLLYPCTGCSKQFCRDDLKKHIEALSIQLSELEKNREKLHGQLTTQMENSKTLPLMTKIYEWEKESIAKVKQAAAEYKDLLRQRIKVYFGEVEKKLSSMNVEFKEMRQENDYNEFHIQELQRQLEQLQKDLAEPINLTIQEDSRSLVDCISFVSSSTGSQTVIPNILPNARWSPNGVTIAGGNGKGSRTNELADPSGIFVDDDQTIVIANFSNQSIVQWRKDDTNGQVVAGGNGEGNRLNQLNKPTDVLIDKKTDSFLICDTDNNRVVRWFRQSGTTQGEVLIHDINCYGLAMDDQGYLYVSDVEKHEIRRYRIGDKNGTLVAGGNGRGDGLHQLDTPHNVFVDRKQAVYVSDYQNHRVMKWIKDAKAGIVVAGGEGRGKALTQLNFPNGLFVDTSNTAYVADSHNHRVLRYPPGEKKGTVIAGGNGKGSIASQLSTPKGITFDGHGNLYVADWGNHRVQRFSLEQTEFNNL